MTISVLTLLISCGGSRVAPDPGTEITEHAKPIVLTKAESDINKSSNDFGFKLLQTLWENEKGTSLFISPLSASLALSMTAGGAEAETLEQMQTTLGVGGYSVSEMGDYYKKMVSALLSVDPNTTFEVANAIWTDYSISLKSDYIDFAKNYYHSEINSDNLSSPATVQKINAWCAANTHDKITKILDDPVAGLKMILLNALYFKGSWQFKFTRTDKRDFTSYSGKHAQLDMMHYTGDIVSGIRDGLKAISLPYGNGAFSMLVILPEGDLTIDKAIASLSSESLAKLEGSMYEREVILSLPKFKMEYERSFKDPLMALGMTRAFTPSAQFPGISNSSLMIDEVKQKTFVDVNETGTEAAAVTAVYAKLTSVGPGAQPFEFNANRPFIFAIRESSTGAILFIGAKTQ